jgi:hypothetical protein
MSPGAQNLKTEPDALGTAKHENNYLSPKTSPGAQNLKTRADALGKVEKESGSSKLENGTRYLRYRRK